MMILQHLADLSPTQPKSRTRLRPESAQVPSRAASVTSRQRLLHHLGGHQSPLHPLVPSDSRCIRGACSIAPFDLNTYVDLRYLSVKSNLNFSGYLRT